MWCKNSGSFPKKVEDNRWGPSHCSETNGEHFTSGMQKSSKYRAVSTCPTKN